jgi:dethiobiotin synthetase
VSLFLTGIGTGVGKTFVAIEVLYWLRSRRIRAVGVKPICHGDREDARRLLAASVEGISVELNSVWPQITGCSVSRSPN